jgi:hypothetical protein
MASKPAKEASADYTVGRGQPPQHSQFKPGQSGNPGGRKKGCLNLKTVVRRAMESDIELTLNGVTQQMPMLQALILGLAQQGLRGNIKAIELFLGIAERHCDSPEEEVEELGEEDLAILARSLTRASKSQRAGGASEGADPAGSRANRPAKARGRGDVRRDKSEAGDD